MLSEMAVVLVKLATQIPDPDMEVPRDLIRPRDVFLGLMKWGGFAIAAGSFLHTGIKLAMASKSGQGSTTAADAVSEVPYKVVGVLLISGLGAGVLGMFL